MIIIPGEFDGVFADAFRGQRLRRGLEHNQGARCGDGGIARAASGLGAFVFAHGAGASVAQVDEIVVGYVAVGPLDIDASAGRDVHLDGLRIGRGGRRLERRLHGISIAQGGIQGEAWGVAEITEIPVKSGFALQDLKLSGAVHGTTM